MSNVYMKKRRVAFKRYVKTGEGLKVKWELQEIGEGDFLDWGVDYEELEGGPGMFTVGIIETGLGIIELVRADYLRFLTRGEDTVPDELSPSEALYGFMGWLTTRALTVTLGAEHNCAGIPDLIVEYCKANGLEEPREGWQHQYKHPEEAQP